ncbi:DUF1579 family protein [Prosthecobacter sp.]|uniref:DUF1579 family protein n=1 Tax=Prosthecobacter sp. TaxID=1965333 RepID=UPI00378305AC
MKTLLLTLCLLACASTNARDLGASPLFKHYVGTWTASGELKGENSTLEIKEEWTGSADGENSFVVKGTRSINGDTQPFQWTISYNEGTDSYEATLTGAEGSQMVHFEGHVSEEKLTLELKTITGNGEGSITVHETLAGDAKDVIESKVTMTGDTGQTTLQGVIKHEKQKKP